MMNGMNSWKKGNGWQTSVTRGRGKIAQGEVEVPVSWTSRHPAWTRADIEQAEESGCALRSRQKVLAEVRASCGLWPNCSLTCLNIGGHTGG
eukprot:647697-Pelagomonas_calceolata.AAC.1